MPSKRRRSRRWNSWIEATIKLTVLTPHGFASILRRSMNIIRKRVYPMYIDEDELHIKLKEFDEMPLKNNFRLNKALVAVGINIGLTSGSISIHVWQWNGRRIVLSNFRLSFNIHAEIRSFRRFGGSETGEKRFVCIVSRAVGHWFSFLRNQK